MKLQQTPCDSSLFKSWDMETTNTQIDIMGVGANSRWTFWHEMMNI
jgi:hypothetical protein